MRKCVVFIFLISMLYAQKPYFLKSELPEYLYYQPLVCEIEVPSGIVNGFYVPKHKQLVIIKPAEYVIAEQKQSTAEQKQTITEEKQSILKPQTEETEKLQETKKEQEIKKEKIVIDTIPDELDKEVSVAFYDLPIKVALGQLAIEYGLKFILSNDVQDVKISCFAEKSKLSNVLDDITTQAKATYSYKDGKIYIYSFGTKLFKIVLPSISHSFSSSISTSGFGGTQSITESANTTATTTSSSEAGPNTKVEIKIEEMKVYDEIEKSLKAVLSKEGKYGINKNTGIITITDYAENLNQAEKVLTEINKEFAKQVYLRVKIVEVDLTEKYSQGINWDWLSSNLKHSLSSSFFLVEQGNTYIFRSTGSANAGTTEKGAQIILKLLEEFGNVKIISQPSIAVLNTQPASIQVGAVKNYISNITQETTQLGLLTGYGTSQITEGLTLGLIPKINDDGKIYISLMPTLKEVAEIRSIPVAGGGKIEAPDVNTRALNTSVIVQKGDTIILGGLMKETTNMKEQRTPFLGKVPVLKYFFSQKVKAKTKSELVVLLSVEEVK
ncbi:MAG: hypothetical protein QXV73_04420 [Candidatus Micrarchaeia archaeon]